MTRNRTTEPRGGFSLIELLAVMAILAVLTAITVGVIVSIRGNATGRVTEESLTKIHTALDQQRDMLVAKCQKDRRTKTADFTALVSYCGGDEDRAEGLWVLMNMRMDFPQSVAEATTDLTIGPVTARRRPAFAAAAGASTASADQQAAILLFLALSERSRNSDGVQTDQILQGDIPVGARTFRVFRDGWGTHIAFVRHAQNAELDGAQYATSGTSRDPFDPRGKLFNGGAGTNWPNTANGTRTGVEKLLFQGATTFDGRNKVLTAWSAGPNKVFDSVANALGSDDVFSYRVKKQGQRAE